MTLSMRLHSSGVNGNEASQRLDGSVRAPKFHDIAAIQDLSGKTFFQARVVTLILNKTSPRPSLETVATLEKTESSVVILLLTPSSLILGPQAS